MQTTLTDLAIVGLPLFVISYVIGSCIYHLFFHPLANFPGPKLATLTTWYEGYYDCLRYKGRYTFKLRDLHEKYGT